MRPKMPCSRGRLEFRCLSRYDVLRVRSLRPSNIFRWRGILSYEIFVFPSSRTQHKLVLRLLIAKDAYMSGTDVELLLKAHEKLHSTFPQVFKIGTYLLRKLMIDVFRFSVDRVPLDHYSATQVVPLRCFFPSPSHFVLQAFPSFRKSQNILSKFDSSDSDINEKKKSNFPRCLVEAPEAAFYCLNPLIHCFILFRHSLYKAYIIYSFLVSIVVTCSSAPNSDSFGDVRVRSRFGRFAFRSL